MPCVTVRLDAGPGSIADVVLTSSAAALETIARSARHLGGNEGAAGSPRSGGPTRGSVRDANAGASLIEKAREPEKIWWAAIYVQEDSRGRDLSGGVFTLWSTTVSSSVGVKSSARLVALRNAAMDPRRGPRSKDKAPALTDCSTPQQYDRVSIDVDARARNVLLDQRFRSTTNGETKGDRSGGCGHRDSFVHRISVVWNSRFQAGCSFDRHRIPRHACRATSACDDDDR